MSRCLAIALLSHAASAESPAGAEHSLAMLARGLAGRGHRVGVVAPGPWALAAPLARAGVEVACIPSRACWLTYHDPRAWPVVALKWMRWAWPERATGRIAEHLLRFGPDVVHVNCLPHLRGAQAAGAAGRPVVWHLREILPAGRRRAWFARSLERHATRIVAVSEAVAAWVRAEGLGARVTVIPNGVDPRSPSADAGVARRELGIPEDGVLVGLLGQLVPHKGARGFVEAAARALAAEPDLRFMIAGPGPASFRAQVERAIAGTASPGRFHLLPARPSGERLIEAADVVCVATRTPDPLPRVVLEAMAAARPVVAFRSGGTPEMVAHEGTGLLVPPGDTGALAEAFVRLARRPAERDSMGAEGARRAREEFSTDRHLDRMEALFRSVAR